MNTPDIPEKREKADVVVVGAGLVGCLAALAMSKRGHQVLVMESRPDLRLPEQRQLSSLRSINLAVSSRGISAMESIDPEMAHRVLQHLIPVHARMVHDLEGRQSSQNYGLHGETINSIDRAQMNRLMLDELDADPRITVRFQHRLVGAKMGQDPNQLLFSTGKDQKTVGIECAIVVGADGSFSRTRDQLQRAVRMNFTQQYIDHLYLELRIPASKDGDYAISPNHLHIWPRHEYMLMALANNDGSFTSTMFAPKHLFEALDTEEKFLSHFENQFKDAYDMIGKDALALAYNNNPRGSLVSVTCDPYNSDGRAIIIGDAAHSMVPFYGQGMNCGFEDVRVLMELIDKNNGNYELAFNEYTEVRRDDLKAIIDLAMRNYVEMRHSVTSWRYLLRKKVDALLTTVLGDKRWIPMYTMVSFRPDISYSQAVVRDQWQTGLLTRVGRYFALGTVYGLGLLAPRRFRGLTLLAIMYFSRNI